MPEAKAPQSAAWLAEELVRQLTRALEPAATESVSITWAPHELTASEIDPARQDLLWQEQALSLAPDARIWIAASQKSWEQVGGRILRSAGVEDGDAGNVRATYLEILKQALSGVASAAGARARRESCCGESRSAPPAAPVQDLTAYSLSLRFWEEEFPLLAAFSAALVNLGAAPAVTAPPPAGAAEPAAPQIAARSIDLLLDVELPVSVSFGRAQLPLKDVIKLTTGSIVELNRSVTEPVEVIVNNCVIARGEVVVVEGNYGIRIKQVVSRQERLRTLY